MGQDDILKILKDGRRLSGKKIAKRMKVTISSANTSLRKLIKQKIVFRREAMSKTRHRYYIYWRIDEDL